MAFSHADLRQESLTKKEISVIYVIYIMLDGSADSWLSTSVAEEVFCVLQQIINDSTMEQMFRASISEDNQACISDAVLSPICRNTVIKNTRSWLIICGKEMYSYDLRYGYNSRA